LRRDKFLLFTEDRDKGWEEFFEIVAGKSNVFGMRNGR